MVMMIMMMTMIMIMYGCTDVVVVGIRLGVLGAYLHKRTNAEISEYFNSISECMYDWTACSNCLGR